MIWKPFMRLQTTQKTNISNLEPFTTIEIKILIESLQLKGKRNTLERSCLAFKAIKKTQNDQTYLKLIKEASGYQILTLKAHV